MVDFRYHLVSIIAVFLALAVGMIIGTAALNGAVLNDLEDRVDQLQSQNDELQAEGDQASADAAAGDAFAGESGPFVLPARLAGDSVVVLTTPGFDQDLVDLGVAAVQQAGATVTGQVDITDAVADPAKAEAIAELVPQLMPEGSALPETQDAYELLGALLSEVLLVRPGEAGATPAEIATALGGLEGLGVIDVGTIAAPASLSLSVVGPGTDDAEADQALTDAVTPVLIAMDSGGRGSLVAGPTSAAEAQGTIAEIRGSRARDSVSTLDNLDRTVGQTSVPAALQVDAAGTVGQYGTAKGATAPVPPLA